MNHFCVGSGFESLGDKPLPRLLLSAPSPRPPTPGTRVGIHFNNNNNNNNNET